MRNYLRIIAGVFVLAFLMGCSETDVTSPQKTQPENENMQRAEEFVRQYDRNLNSGNNFVAVLSGENEVPPVETDASGTAAFHFERAGNRIFFFVFVENIENVIMAHIHLGGPDENGPVVLWLYPDNPPPQEIPGEFNGVLVADFDTADDLVGPLAGMTLADLKAEMAAGNTYVNVHTTQNPGGEIRGQIMPLFSGISRAE